MNRRLRRLERLRDGERVSIPQTDGTLAIFTASTFWWQMFQDGTAAATGEPQDSTLARALENATPQGREQVAALIQDQGGDFLAGRGSDLSEPSESAEDRF